MASGIFSSSQHFGQIASHTTSKVMVPHSAPPGLAPPPGLEGLCPPPADLLPLPRFQAQPGLTGPIAQQMVKQIGLADGSFAESDTEVVTNAGTSSFNGHSSSEHGETESDSEDHSAMWKVDAPCFVPGLPLATSASALKEALPVGLLSASEARFTQKTPLKKGAGLFVPGGGPSLPFVPMAQVEESWNQWYGAQSQPPPPPPQKDQPLKAGRKKNARRGSLSTWLSTVVDSTRKAEMAGYRYDAKPT